LIPDPVAGLRFVGKLGFDGMSLPILRRVREPVFLVSEIASAEGFDQSKKMSVDLPKKAFQP